MQVDLLQKTADKDKVNLYVTYMVDLLFAPEELVALSPNELVEDSRYVTMKGEFCE